jgi:DNA-binding HxlR family transcriptional regulator
VVRRKPDDRGAATGGAGAARSARASRRVEPPRPRTVLPEFDRLVHERIRLGIMSALAANTTLSFQELKEVLETTDGNLSVHARKLEEAEYLACTKSFVGRVPRTDYALTAAGRTALERYLAEMEQFIQSTKPGAH